MQVALERTIEIIQTNQNFVVTTHINPDGDGIGSELGLARFLRDQSKKATVINATPTPRNYQFLDRFKEIHLYEPLSLNVELATAEVIFILDISKWERLGPMSEVIRNHPGLKICIDHHPLCGNFADINLVCQDACASGELVLQVIHTMGGSMTRDIAEPLYVSILTDTGAFRFPNTNASTHDAASHLLSTGINASEIYEQIYERCSPSRVKLLGIALCNLEYLHCGRLAWTAISQTMIRQTGAEPEELEGFVDVARGIRNVEASLLFIELPDGKIKVSLRSKGEVDVNKFAARFGGGGHRHASGILLEGSLGSIVGEVLSQTSSLFPVAEKLVS